MGSSVGVMVSMLVSSVVDHEFIGGVMVSVLVECSISFVHRGVVSVLSRVWQIMGSSVG